MCNVYPGDLIETTYRFYLRRDLSSHIEYERFEKNTTFLCIGRVMNDIKKDKVLYLLHSSGSTFILFFDYHGFFIEKVS